MNHTYGRGGAVAFLAAYDVHHAKVEIYFSVVQRKVVTPNDFTDLNEVADGLRAFEDLYNATAQPFQGKFTTSDLDDLLVRLDRHTADHLRRILCRPGSMINAPKDLRRRALRASVRKRLVQGPRLGPGQISPAWMALWHPTWPWWRACRDGQSWALLLPSALPC
ncbi:hypothetical protein [Streptomyces sp. NBC_01197]|uniref:hypothetical protein n=1 Tax=Streptomyces sp. NBC_01197 TaxID=2903768 RepID=UPI002E0F7829|nr:hypothetical protein OG452_25785 [Streptomyces sp. NBC_01197]